MTLTEYLTGIANAIRGKTGESIPIPASEFASRISAIETGKTPEISVSANGLITATAGKFSATKQLSSTDDPDFVASNIKSSATIFGLKGSYAGKEVVTLSTENPPQGMVSTYKNILRIFISDPDFKSLEQLKNLCWTFSYGTPSVGTSNNYAGIGGVFRIGDEYSTIGLGSMVHEFYYEPGDMPLTLVDVGNNTRRIDIDTGPFLLINQSSDTMLIGQSDRFCIEYVV